MTTTDQTDTRLRLRIMFGDDLRLGPGKADLLEAIRDSGSISAAGRAMGMSYKRAWSLVGEMNDAFRTPLVERTRGGAQGGGARVTEAGLEVLTRFRAIEAKLARIGAEDIEAIRALMDVSGGK